MDEVNGGVEKPKHMRSRRNGKITPKFVGGADSKSNEDWRGMHKPKKPTVFPEDLDRRGWRTIDYLEYQGKTGDNEHLRNFIDRGLMKRLREAQFSSLHNFKTLKKEVTEACGVAEVVMKVLKDINLRLLNGKKRGDSLDEIRSGDILFFDICAGKGIGTLLLALMFPDSEILMVDKNPRCNYDHVGGFPNIKYAKQDINFPSFETLITNTLAATNKKVAILLGIHLCGYLSSRVIDVFNRTGEISAIILCPCCLPRKDRTVINKARALRVYDYQYWCTWLYAGLRSDRKNMAIDENIGSNKNVVVMGMRVDGEVERGGS
eukprot:comp14257_c0_seq1/m.10252 comp14257_c0_seq1/g.10252  ORF comp14257_c0_seq1/g.10252 comp14257_c0_seq1/m.10252 type:complete len:320 (-) comp14257_c0_seq1:76-1035(-)